jgi:hypothetical protein
MDTPATLRLAGLTAPQARELRSVARTGSGTGTGAPIILRRLRGHLGLVEWTGNALGEQRLTEAGRRALAILEDPDAAFLEAQRRREEATGSCYRYQDTADGVCPHGNAGYHTLEAAPAPTASDNGHISEAIEAPVEAPEFDELPTVAVPGQTYYAARAVHIAADADVALCGARLLAAIDTAAPASCPGCSAADARIDRAVDRVLERRRQTEAPAPALPGVDAAVVEASLVGLPAEPLTAEELLDGFDAMLDEHNARVRAATDTEKRRTLVAHATTEGDPELIVAAADVDDLTFTAEHVRSTRSLLVDPDTGEFSEDLDEALAAMGYRRTQEWAATRDGANTFVDPR